MPLHRESLDSTVCDRASKDLLFQALKTSKYMSQVCGIDPSEIVLTTRFPPSSMRDVFCLLIMWDNQMSRILIKMLIVQVHLKVESRNLEEVLDPDLKSRTNNHETLLQVAKIGVHCTDRNIKQRPFIGQVSQELELVLHMIDELPTNPPSTSCSPRQESSSGGGTGKSSGSDFSLPELGGKDSHIKFDGMAWIDIKALDGGSLQDFCDNNLQDYE